jgi:hypothetical protein
MRSWVRLGNNLLQKCRERLGWTLPQILHKREIRAPGCPLEFWTILSKRFYDTSIEVATGAARCGSFVGKVFSLLVVSSRWTWWTWWFMWFGPPEHNTLRPRENWVVLCSSMPYLSLSFYSTLWKWRLPGPFIAQGQVVTMKPRARQVAPRWLKPYTTSRAIMARSS